MIFKDFSVVMFVEKPMKGRWNNEKVIIKF